MRLAWPGRPATRMRRSDASRCVHASAIGSSITITKPKRSLSVIGRYARRSGVHGKTGTSGGFWFRRNGRQTNRGMTDSCGWTSAEWRPISVSGPSRGRFQFPNSLALAAVWNLYASLTATARISACETPRCSVRQGRSFAQQAAPCRDIADLCRERSLKSEMPALGNVDRSMQRHSGRQMKG